MADGGYYREARAHTRGDQPHSYRATEPALFRLVRKQDVTGVSGTGIVAHGVRWPDGTVTIRWQTERASTVNWDRIEDAEHVHGHAAATVFEWLEGGEWKAVD